MNTESTKAWFYETWSNRINQATQEEITIGRDGIAEWMKQNEDLSFVKNVKLWLQRHERPINTITELHISTDITDITEGDDKYKRYIPGPYHRINFVFRDGSELYGKSLYYTDWNITDDKKENWGYEWVRQIREANNGTNSVK